MSIENHLIKSFWEEIGINLPDRYGSVVYELLLVHEQYIDIPSIVTKSWQRETNSPWFNVLSNVTLADHSIHVAKAISGIADPKSLIFSLGIIAALGHDLGKNRVYRNPARGKYGYHQHAWDSADALKELVGASLTPKENEAIYWAIYDHHGPSHDRLTRMLKVADERAREHEGATPYFQHELNGYDNETTLLSWDDPHQMLITKPIVAPWFNARAFCFNYLYKLINNPMNQHDFEAFSIENGYCYFFVETIFQAFCRIAEDNGASELAHQAKSDKNLRQDILAHIAQKLREAKFFGEHLLPLGWYCFKYVLNFKEGDTRTYTLMPIRTRAFTLDTMRLEAKKCGILSQIQHIRAKKRDNGNEK